MNAREVADRAAARYERHVVFCSSCIEQRPACPRGHALDRLMMATGLSYAGALVRAGVAS